MPDPAFDDPVGVFGVLDESVARPASLVGVVDGVAVAAGTGAGSALAACPLDLPATGAWFVAGPLLLAAELLLRPGAEPLLPGLGEPLLPASLFVPAAPL